MNTNIIFEKISEQLKSDAPQGWEQLKMLCHSYDDALKVKTFYKTATESQWSSYDCGDFEIMDLCEELVEIADFSTDQKWTKLDFILSSDGSYTFEYGYGDPGIFDS